MCQFLAGEKWDLRFCQPVVRLHEPTIPGTELSVIKEHGAQEIPIVFDINPRDRHMTRILHNNEDNNSIANIDDPMPGCSHW